MINMNVIFDILGLKLCLLPTDWISRFKLSQSAFTF